MTTSIVDLSRFVSNTEKNIYTIYNLPEEVIAVVFAYVSRSSDGFRESLRKLLTDEDLDIHTHATGIATTFSEKASRFHEKWVVGYGHSSVAEHAVAHVGVEKISRLASAELEIANSFNSFTEYSQRYQRPQRGDFYIPASLQDHPGYLAFQEKIYNIYEQLMTRLHGYLQTTLSREEGESDKRFFLRTEKIAFEDARYVLTLGTFTNLGLTGNGRALRDTLVYLLSSPYKECVELAQSMRQEIEYVIPTLLKHIQPNSYLLQAEEQLESLLPSPVEHKKINHPTVRFVQMPTYLEALQFLTTQLLIRKRVISYEEANKQAEALSLAEHEQIATAALSWLRFFDNPLGELKHLSYTLEMTISEANWHQLLRHNRSTHFTYGPPTVCLGYTIPPLIQEAGLTELFCRSIQLSEGMHQEIMEIDPLAAPYVITNAHHRQITATTSLWGLYHLINLRTSKEAQWDIRHIFEEVLAQLKSEHPVLAKYAQRRL